MGEILKWIRILVPPRVERQHVLLEHALEKAYHVRAVSEDEPASVRVAMGYLETEPLVECP
jgi:hypothetical protein